MNTTNKAALVTGGPKRIGKALAVALAEKGYDIALHYNSSDEDARSTAADIKAAGVDCSLFRCDLSNEQELQTLMKNVHTVFPNLSVLINNASIFDKLSISETSIGDFNNYLALHVKAPFILTRDFAALYGHGHVINIVDSRISKNDYHYAVYTLTKKALADLTSIAACEFAPDLRVNAIAPGIILPPDSQSIDYLDRISKNIPLKRKGNLDNIINALYYLLQNDFVTGQIVTVDGGESL
jgi:pteridine reductase